MDLTLTDLMEELNTLLTIMVVHTSLRAQTLRVLMLLVVATFFGGVNNGRLKLLVVTTTISIVRA